MAKDAKEHPLAVPGERAPYEAPALLVIATVEEATAGALELGADAGGLFS